MSQSLAPKVLLVSLALAVSAGGASAEYKLQPGYPPPPPPPPGYQQAPVYPYGPYGGQVGVTPLPGTHTHDGFYLRLQLGPGYTSMVGEAGPIEINVKGPGGGFGLALGGAVVENFIIFGHLIADTAIEPNVKVTGGISGESDGSASLSGFGVGAAWYLMPVNLYLSGSLLASQISVSDKNGDKVGETKLGFGMDLSIGKEWWVSENWGLGVAGQFMAARMKDKSALAPGGPVPTWTAWGFTIALSATFN